MLRAHHIGGPLDGPENDVSLASPRTPWRLQYAPAPVPAAAIVPAGYFLVGYNDDQLDSSGLPDVVAYQLDRDASTLQPHSQYGDEGMEEGTAVYRLLP